MADKKIFREKSLQKVNSPESLNEYIRVANPGIWLLIVSVLAIILGSLVWAIFGTIESTVKAGVFVNEQTEAVFYIKEEDYSKIEIGQTLRIDEKEFEIATISNQPLNAGENLDEYLQHILSVSEEAWIYCGTFEANELAPGLYSANIIIEAIHPIKFVLN